jgi:hypothetical protein
VISAVLTALTRVTGVPSEHFFLFDKVAYWMIHNQNRLTIASWTEICHGLMRKCPFSRNEDLMAIYRAKLAQNVAALTGAHYAKMAFVISRSQFPFEELIYRQALVGGFIRRSNSYELGSLIPSLARSRFRDFDLLGDMCKEYVVAASTDVSKHLENPRYLKIFLERLIQLDFHRVCSSESDLFFEQIQTLIQ